MATSGTFSYAPSLGELTLFAFQLAEVRNTSLEQEHLWSARTATNMMLASWSNRGVNLWAVDLQSVYFTQTPATLTATGNGTTATLTYASINTPVYPVGSSITVTGVTPIAFNGTFTVTASGNGTVSFASTAIGPQTVAGAISTASPTATYSVDPATVVILDAYVTNTSSSTNIDRVILPISRTEYASYPNKQQTSASTVYWFDRLLSPTVTLWPIPDGTSYQLLNYYRVRRIQDASMTNAQNVEIPYLWLDAFAYGMGHRLALIWNPQKALMLKPLADEAYMIAADQNVEQAQQYISPQLEGYYR